MYHVAFGENDQLLAVLVLDDVVDVLEHAPDLHDPPETILNQF